MGIHTGDAEQAGGRYVGLGVNRAARIAAVAARRPDPGVGRDPRPRMQTTRSPGVTAARPGRAPAQGPGRAGPHLPGRGRRACRRDFPPLRTLDARPNNLPTQLTTFVGRDAELDEAAGLLATTRLLTLTGPGGTGKTRLSLQLAARGR